MQEWVKVYVQEWLSRLKPRTDTATIPTNPNPGTPCSTGPTLTSVFNATKDELTFSFTGDLQTVNWYILSGNTTVRNGSVVPNSKTATEIGFATLASGTYKFRIDGANCVNTTAINFTVVSDTPTCAGGPVIGSVTNISRTGLTFSWTGLNVPEIVWTIKSNGTTLRSGSTTTSSTIIPISFTQLNYGTYQFQIVGLTCPTTSPAVSFTIVDNTPPVSLTGRHIYMGLTGYGFDKNEATGMDAGWMPRIEALLNMNFQGTNFKGIDGIRVNIKWHEYEPTEGNFDDATLIRIINWCAARNLLVSVVLIPYRREHDGMLPIYDQNKLIDGSIWWFEGKNWPFQRSYMPSMNSDKGRSKFRACAKHLASVMKQYSNVDYIALATAHTEEYQLVREYYPVELSGYGDADIAKWAIFSGGQPVPKPAVWVGDEHIYYWQATPQGKLWGDFQTEALREFHREFSRGVREGGMRVATMYAGVGAPTGVFDFSTRLDRIYSAGTPDQPDITYSSEGGSGTQNDKLMATDLNLGTFPGSDPGIEFDPDDVSLSQAGGFPPYDADLNWHIFYDYGASFYRRGGKIIHFAMAFHPDKIPQLAEALYKLKTEFLDSNSGMTGMEQGEQINHTVTSYGGQSFRGEWFSRGGGLNKQVKIKLQ
jgi:hypothetical protein